MKTTKKCYTPPTKAVIPQQLKCGINLLAIIFCCLYTTSNAQTFSAFTSNCPDVTKPSSSAFLKFVNSQDFMVSATSLLHAKTRPYKSSSGCRRYAYDILWLDQDGIVHQQVFDAITQQLIKIPPPPGRPKHPPKGSRSQLSGTPPNRGPSPGINSGNPRPPQNTPSRQPPNGISGAGAAGGSGGGRGRP